MRVLVGLALAIAASAVVSDENEWRPPFITTPPEAVERMLEMAGTRPGDLVVDLGSGDGRIVIAAARNFGARGLGIELDAALVEKSRQAARAAAVADRVSFVQGDVLVADIIRRGQLAGRYRTDFDAAIKAVEILAFINGMETSWLLDPSLPLTDVFKSYAEMLGREIEQPVGRNGAVDQ